MMLSCVGAVASWQVCLPLDQAVQVQGHRVVFLVKKLYSHSAFFHPGEISVSKLNVGGNSAMD